MPLVPGSQMLGWVGAGLGERECAEGGLLGMGEEWGAPVVCRSPDLPSGPGQREPPLPPGLLDSLEYPLGPR